MIRTHRGRWGVLSPCYLWEVETEYKKYPSLMNFLADDTSSRPTKLLNIHIKVDKAKIVNGLKYLLREYPRYKNYLHSSPKGLEFVNPFQPEFAKLFTETLLEARDAIQKFRIKGQEVLDKRSKFEMLGATIIGDQAVFDYNAERDVNNIIYGINDDECIDRLDSVGKMIESYIHLFDKMPDFMLTRDQNPNIFYMMRKYHTEQIAKILCTVDVTGWVPLDFTTISSLVFKINDKVGSLWPFIIFPKSLHSGIKKGDGTKELLQMLKYQIDYETVFKKDITYRLQMLESCMRPSQKDALDVELTKVDGTESNDDYSESVEVLEIENSEDLVFESDDGFVDKWVMWDEDSYEEPEKVPDFTELFKPTDAPAPTFSYMSNVAPHVPNPSEVKVSWAQPVVQGQTGPQAAGSAPTGWGQPTGAPPSGWGQKPMQPTGAVPTGWGQQGQPPAQQQQGQQPPAQQPVQQPVQQPARPKIPWDQRFKKLAQTGHVIEPHNPLSPFGKNQVFWEGVKYENMLAAIYNKCMQEILPDGVQFKTSANKCRNHILAYNKKEECVIWFKDKGIEMLKQLMTTPQYITKKTQMSMNNLGQLTYIYSRRKQQDVLLEPWIGVIKVDSGLPYLTLMIGGWNAAYQVQLE